MSRQRPIRAIVLGCLLGSVAQAGWAASDLPALARRLADGSTGSGAPGVVLALVADGHVIADASSGEASLESGHALTRDTRFPIGDLSKLYAALVALQLEKRGELDLDAPVTRYLTAYSSGSSLPAPTARQLLSQHAGLPANWLHGLYHEPDKPSAALPRSALQPVVSPGRLYAYSNPGYELLGRVLAAAGGTGYPELLRSQVLQPLGTSDVSLHAHGDDARPHLDGESQPMILVRDRVALGVRASLADLEALLGAMTSLDPDFPVAAMATPQNAGSALDLGNRYGFGFALLDDPRTALGTHATLSGFYPGYFMRVDWWPRRHLAVLALANGDDAGDALQSAIRKLSDAWFAHAGIRAAAEPGAPKIPQPFPDQARPGAPRPRYSTALGLLGLHPQDEDLEVQVLGLHFRATPRGDGWYRVSLELLHVLPIRLGALRRVLVAPARVAGKDLLIGSLDGRRFILGSAFQPLEPDPHLTALAGHWKLSNPDRLTRRLELDHFTLGVEGKLVVAAIDIPFGPLHRTARLPLLWRDGKIVFPGLGPPPGISMEVLGEGRECQLMLSGYRFKRADESSP